MAAPSALDCWPHGPPPGFPTVHSSTMGFNMRSQTDPCAGFGSSSTHGTQAAVSVAPSGQASVAHPYSQNHAFQGAAGGWGVSVPDPSCLPSSFSAPVCGPFTSIPPMQCFEVAAPQDFTRIDVHLVERCDPNSNALHHQVTNLMNERRLAQNSEDRMRTKLAAIQGKLRVCSDREARIKELEAALHAAKEKLFEAESRAVRAEGMHDFQAKEIARLSNLVRDAEARASEAQKQLEEEQFNMRRQLREMQDRLDATAAERDAAQGQVAGLNARLRESEAAKDKLMMTSAAEQRRLQEELDTLMSRLATIERARDTALLQVGDLELRLQKEREIGLAAKREMSEMQLRHEGELAGARRELAAVELRRVGLEAERDGALRKAQALEERLAEEERRRLAMEAKLAQGEQERERLREELQLKQQRLSALEAQLHEAQLHATKLQQDFDKERRGLNDKIFQLQNRLSAAERDAEGLRAELHQTESRLKDARDQLARMEQRASELQNDAAGERAKLNEELFQLQSNNAGLQNDLNNLRNEMGRYEQRLEQAANDLAAANERAANAEAGWENSRMEMQNHLAALQSRVTIIEEERDQSRQQAQYWENRCMEADQALRAARQQIQQMEMHINHLEVEIANLRNQLAIHLKSHTSLNETYKVATFEIAWKLAKIDGTDDGLFNGLPIEVEGEGLFRELVAAGRKPLPSVAPPQRQETYVVKSWDMAERLVRMSGKMDGKYEGRPIEIEGEGLFIDLINSGRRRMGPPPQPQSITTINTPTRGTPVSVTSSSPTFIVANMEIAAKLSKMNPADNGTYKGLPIEIKGQGLFRDLRRR